MSIAFNQPNALGAFIDVFIEFDGSEIYAPVKTAHKKHIIVISNPWKWVFIYSTTQGSHFWVLLC